MTDSKSFKMVYLALLVAIGLVLHLVENALPNPFVLPGAKLGLANIVTLLGLVLFGFRDGMIIAFLRVMLGNLLGGTLFSIPFFLSFAGGIFSACVMGLSLILLKKEWISVIGVSLLGAASHNLAQLIVASVIMNQIGILFVYMPYLMTVAMLTGFFIGLASIFLSNLLKKNLSAIS